MDNIEQLQNAKDEIEKAIALEEQRLEDERLKGPHKSFNVGDLVTDGNNIGRVKWVENLACLTTIDMGKMGIDLINNNRGFLAFATRNEYSLVPAEVKHYLETPINVNLTLTGEEIEAVFSSYFGIRNINPDKTRSKILDAFEAVRMNLSDSGDE